MISFSNTIGFLAGTFAISLAAFGLMVVVPGAQSPEGPTGLPIWLVAVWSPSITALVLAVRRGVGRDVLRSVVTIRGTAPALLIGIIPLVILVGFVVLGPRRADWNALPPMTLLALIGLNLILGPLGEELGWRGFLQPAFSGRLGWFTASLAVGAIWAVWHAPLWLIESPQREIPFQIFVVHAIAYSILMGAAWSLAPHSTFPAVILHLLFNVVSGAALLLGVAETSQWYRATALLYLVGALVVAVVVHLGVSRAGTTAFVPPL